MEKVLKYKVLDLMDLYNFNIKFVFIQLHIKSYKIFHIDGLFTAVKSRNGGENKLSLLTRVTNRL